MKLYKNISGLEFRIIDRLEGRNVLVQFIETGSIVKCDSRNCSAGKVSDPFHKSRLGIGYMGHYQRGKLHKKTYQLWSNMMKRCYDPNDARGYYGKGVIVDPSWHCYATFQQEIQTIKDFKEWSTIGGMELDKDFLGDGKTYSVNTCAFIKASVNRSAGKSGKKFVGGEWVTSSL